METCRCVKAGTANSRQIPRQLPSPPESQRLQRRQRESVRKSWALLHPILDRGSRNETQNRQWNDLTKRGGKAQATRNVKPFSRRDVAPCRFRESFTRLKTKDLRETARQLHALPREGFLARSPLRGLQKQQRAAARMAAALQVFSTNLCHQEERGLLHFPSVARSKKLT